MNGEGVLEVKKQLASAVAANRSEDIKRLLLRLRQELVVSEELLRETKIGLTVGKLRSNPSKQIADLAKDIVQKWKRDVGPVRTPAKAEPKSKESIGSPAPGGSKPQLANEVPSTSSTNTSREPSVKPEVKTEPEVKQEKGSSAAPPAPSSSVAASKSPPVTGAPRNAKTDGVKLELYGDKTRDTCIGLLYDAIVFDSGAPSELVFERAKEIESVVLTKNGNEPSPGYRTKMRQLMNNLKVKNNPGLREAVITGELPSLKLYDMSPADMASEEQKAHSRKMEEDNLFKARGAGNTQSETDQFKCSRCKQRKCTYYREWPWDIVLQALYSWIRIAKIRDANKIGRRAYDYLRHLYSV